MKPELSIVIPAFNEERRIGELLTRLLAVSGQLNDPEIIVVDDGSEDATYAIASSFTKVQAVKHEVNKGRGAAINTGISQAHKAWIVVFDADLEYLPEDLPRMFHLIQEGFVVYGDRYAKVSNYNDGKIHRFTPMKNQSIGPLIANHLIALWVWLLFGTYYREQLSGIRIYPSSLMQSYSWRYGGFEGDHEKAAVCLKMKYGVKTCPIDYYPRGKDDGKKIRPSDGFKAIWVFLKIRFTRI